MKKWFNRIIVSTNDSQHMLALNSKYFMQQEAQVSQGLEVFLFTCLFVFRDSLLLKSAIKRCLPVIGLCFCVHGRQKNLSPCV